MPAWRHSSSARFDDVQLLREIYTPELIEDAREIMDRARGKAAEENRIYSERVEFVRAGLEFVAANMKVVPFMERVRRSDGRNREAVDQAVRLCAERDALLAAAPPFAIDQIHFQQRVVEPGSWKAMADYFGPPRPECLNATARNTGASACIPIRP